MNSSPHLIEVALLILVTFLLGCIAGYILRRILRPTDREMSRTAMPMAGADAAATQDAAQPITTVGTTTSSTAKDAGRPEFLAAPRGGSKDDLKKIRGIGPKIEETLNHLGVYHFDQIAGWDERAVTWVDTYLSFRGRIDREEWVKQAKDLAG